MLTAKNVSYWYDTEENTLYKDVNLDFEAGKLYGIIGSSGAGKTTLLTMLSGLDKPRRGSILYEGTDIQKIGLTQYRNRYVSIVFQAYNLLPYMSALDNVLTAMAITIRRMTMLPISHSKCSARLASIPNSPIRTYKNYRVVNNNELRSCAPCVVQPPSLLPTNQPVT